MTPLSHAPPQWWWKIQVGQVAQIVVPVVILIVQIGVLKGFEDLLLLSCPGLSFQDGGLIISSCWSR